MKKTILFYAFTLALGSCALSAQDLVLTTTPTGTAGNVYALNSFLANDTTVEAGYFSSVDNTIANLSTGNDNLQQFVVDSDGSGITQANNLSRWEQNSVLTTNDGGQRHAFRYDFGTSATSSFTLGSVEFDVSGVEGAGITAVVVYELADNTWIRDIVDLNSNGTLTVALSEQLAFTSGTTPLDLTSSTNQFTIAFGDPAGITDGVTVSNAVIDEIRFYTVVPEPSAYALLSGLLALSWVMARRRS